MNERITDKRSRCYHGVVYPDTNCLSCMLQRITELEAENAKLRAALHKYVLTTKCLVQ